MFLFGKSILQLVTHCVSNYPAFLMRNFIDLRDSPRSRHPTHCPTCSSSRQPTPLGTLGAWLLTAGTGSEILRQLVTIHLVGHKLVTIRLVRLNRKLVAIQLVGSSPPTSVVGLCCWHPALDQLCLPKQTLWFTNFTCVLSFQFCDPFPDCMDQWCYFSFYPALPLARSAAMTAFLKGLSCPEVLIVR